MRKKDQKKGIKTLLSPVFITILLLLVGKGFLFAGGKPETPNPESSVSANEKSGIENPLIVAETDESIVALDVDGNEVVLSKEPRRVIPNHTSMLGLWYLAGGTAVGRPETRGGTDIPPEAMDLETTGSVVYPNTEKILALRPDFVILSNIDNHRNLQGVLYDVGIENIILSYDNYSDFVHILDLFARLIGNSEIVNKVVPDLHNEVQLIIDKYMDNQVKENPTFLSLFAYPGNVSAELNTAHTAHIASLLGGINIAEIDPPGKGQKRINYSFEHIISKDPDFILITPMGDVKEIEEELKQDMMSNQAWAELSAVKRNNVYFLPEELFLYKPNDKFPEAFEYMAGLLYKGDI